jgi:hypothetical protein
MFIFRLKRQDFEPRIATMPRRNHCRAALALIWFALLFAPLLGNAQGFSTDEAPAGQSSLANHRSFAGPRHRR